jgi:hypothetical protein
MIANWTVHTYYFKRIATIAIIAIISGKIHHCFDDVLKLFSVWSSTSTLSK